MRPLDVDGVRTVAIGTVLWAAAFVVLALRRDDLDELGQGLWLWTCLAGVGLGLLGLEYTRKRRDAIAQALLDEEADLADEPEPVAVDEPELVDDAEPEPYAEPEPHPEPERLDEPIDSDPPVPAPTSRRARRAARSNREAVPAVDTEFFGPVDDTGPDDTGERSTGGRRARRHAAEGNDAATDDGGYRGRRSRR